MKKINHSFLIISIASALVIFGASIALGFGFGLNVGLVTGVFAFSVLILCMLVVNHKNRPTESKKEDDTDQDDAQ